MNPLIEKITDLLRKELQLYGAMMAELEKQQDSVVTRQVEALLMTVDDLNHLAAEAVTLRRSRDEARSQLATELRHPSDIPLTELLPALPESSQIQIQALIQENNNVLRRASRRTVQNHMLLSRSIELMEEFISTLLPGQTTKVYGGDGRTYKNNTANRSTLEVVG